ncbi:MAG: methyltransferase domain-containing protein [Planctomycetota bacterium]
MMTNDFDISHRYIATVAAGLYVDAPLSKRMLYRWRDAICPFGVLMDAIPPGSSVLDVGCGGGLFLLLLAASGRLASGAGIDVCPAAIAVARQAALRLETVSNVSPKTCEFTLAAAWNDWPRGPFDVVSMIDVMHHVSPPLQRPFLAEAAKRLTPGGILLYKDMCRRPLLFAAANRLHDLILARQWIHYVPLDDISRWAGDEGLAVERRLSYRRFLYGHEMIVFRHRMTSQR